MFTIYKRVEEPQTVKKQVRANMKVTLHFDEAGFDTKELEVASSSKGVLVLRDPHYAFDIVASEDLENWNYLLNNKTMYANSVTITSNGKVYDVKLEDGEVYYEVTTMVPVRKNVPVKVGDELTVSIDDGVNWDDAIVLDVTPTQLLAKIESKVGNDYLVFNNSTETEMNGYDYELHDVNYTKQSAE